MSAITDRRDLDFVLFELLGAESLLTAPAFAGFDRNTVGQVLDVAQRIAEEEFLPIAAEMDVREPRFEEGRAILPVSGRSALSAYAAAGLFALPFRTELGGLGAPRFLHTASMGMFTAANTALANYAFLTVAAASLLDTFGSDDLRQAFLPAMLEGRWFGTMCLSETQAGSSLGDIRTTATIGSDGLYRIRGSKMWISGGDHDLSENIVHMVLAKIPGGPPGSKGISLFLVPRQRPSADGTAGPSNHVTLAGLNHKMGQRGTTNCVLNFGDSGESRGYLIGEPHRGMQYMFHMMNEARIGVGHAAVTAALAGYLCARDYAASRTQGRPVDHKDAASAQVPIIGHADVKRMLLAQKAAVEGAQALCLYCAVLSDKIATAESEDQRRQDSALLGLLTPVAKSWPSEHCLEANKWAIQVLGGYGYTRDYPVERLYRDNRLNHIHEGTFGIQGLDLLGRKVHADGAATLLRFVGTMRADIERAGSLASLRPDAATLAGAVDDLVEATRQLLGCAEPSRQLANATLYLDAFGHVVIGWFWLRQAEIAAAGLASDACSGLDRAFYEGKVRTCRYFMRYEMPLARARLTVCASLDATCLGMPVEAFGQ